MASLLFVSKGPGTFSMGAPVLAEQRDTQRQLYKPGTIHHLCALGEVKAVRAIVEEGERWLHMLGGTEHLARVQTHMLTSWVCTARRLRCAIGPGLVHPPLHPTPLPCAAPTQPGA